MKNKIKEGFCIYSSFNCEGCETREKCKKRPSTIRDLKRNVDAGLVVGGFKNEINVVFATGDFSENKKHPDGTRPCILRQHFFTIFKKIDWMNPKWFSDDIVAYLHITQNDD